MEWTEVKVTTESEAVEAVSNILMEAGSSGVAIEDALDLINYQKNNRLGELIDKDNFEHITDGATVSAYFPGTVFLPEILATIDSRIQQLPTFGLKIGNYQIETKRVAETDWATAWKKYYHPVRISRFLTIVPDWEDYQPLSEDEIIIKLDPGMAFGTGTHPTTSLSLQALEIFIRGGETVLDVGTGSGVLSIASHFLGAKKVYAYDLDRVAVTAAQENLALNQLAETITVRENNLLTNIEIQADLIVANILAEIILDLIVDSWRLLKPKGYLILSGIIEEKQTLVLEPLLEQGFELEQILKKEHWLALVLRKPAEEE